MVFGLFHGLLFLPTILSLAGPNEIQTKVKKKETVVSEHNGYCNVPLSQNEKGDIL